MIDGWTKPSAELAAVLCGDLAMSDASEPIQSCARLGIYRQACAVLDAGTRDERRAALARTPATLRPHIEAEARRVFELRRA